MPAVLLFSLPFLYLLVRKPVLRRLALRNAARRPRETVLVLIGSLLGTAIITGSLVVGDSLTRSIRQGAFNSLGPIDELVRTAGPAESRAAAAAVERLRSQDIDGVLPIVSAGAAVGSVNGAVRRAEPHSTVLEVDFARARAFGGDPRATGISGPTPTGNEVVINEALARTLKTSQGRTIDIYAYGATVPVKVARVLPVKGVAGFGDASVFVPLGSLERAASFIPPAVRIARPSWSVAVSNRGDVLSGERLTSRVTSQLAGVLDTGRVSIDGAKHGLLDAAVKTGKQFTQLFVGIGTFSVLAGILLLVNIFVMLAQERKTEMGMLRAVGMRRSSLVGSFTLEGWLYALGASVLGAFAGLGVGRIIVAVAARLFRRGGIQ